MRFFLLLLFIVPLAAAAQDGDARSIVEQLKLDESAVPARELPFWKKPEKIHMVPPGYTDEERARQVAEAQAAIGDVELVPIAYPIPDDVIAEAEVLLARCTPRIIREAANLRWLQDSRHGVDSCMIPEITDKEFLLTNAQHTSGPPMGDHAVAMMLALARGLHRYHAFQLEGRWTGDPEGFPMLEVGGRTILVVGLGGVGTEVARRAAGLGMRVLAIRNSRRAGPDFVEYVGLSEELFTLAGEADFIVNALPLTEATHGLFDAEFFDAAKRGAIFISIGRGESTVTADLIAALKDGRLTAAGLDVTDPEPLPPGHELWTLPNVLITPHVAAETDEGRWRRWAVYVENLRRWVAGDRMLNVVDLERGY
ncbi:MAG: D-2-hydroxyacid dehydrogenase [Woeseiaceae bacterium]|nr:D-2-hydroxyacid dehydrogenase [Woeseiaceae bacterium]